MKRNALPANAISHARSLRHNATDAEKRLWHALREKLPQAKFRRQVPFGPYIADFASHRHKLIIEVDGGQHAAQEEYDTKRTRFLESEGYRVLRFWNNDVLAKTDGVIEEIMAAIALSPRGRGLGEGPVASATGKTQNPAVCRFAPSSLVARSPHPTATNPGFRGAKSSYPSPSRGEETPAANPEIL